MTKDVLLAIQGLQYDDRNENANIETVTAAQYYKRNESHYVVYEELMEGFTEPSKNVIKFKGHTVDLTKKGVVNVHMLFEENSRSITSYTTPYGNILIGIDTESVEIIEQEEHIEVNIAYALEMNYEHLSDCTIRMHIHAKDAEGFSLQQ